jgi:hypothetical protein
VDDATAIDGVESDGATVAVGDGCITVDGAVAVKVFSLDGRCVYNGGAATVAVEQGVYVVVTEIAGGSVAAKKVVVE